MTHTQDKISLHQIHVFAHHGVYKEEATLGQKFIISADFYLDMHHIGESDNISDGICYGQLTEDIILFCQSHRFNTLESLAHKLAKFLLFKHTIVNNITIKIEKPNAPIKHYINYIAVKVSRSRANYQNKDVNPLVKKER